MAKITSVNGILDLICHEAIVMDKYLDSQRIWTIGIGHTKNAGEPNPEKINRTFSLEEIVDIFLADIKNCEERTNYMMNKNIEQHQFDAAVSFDFNTGAITRASWVKFLNKNNTEKAKYWFKKWNKPNEIIKRRHKEFNLMFNGEYSNDGFANIYNADKYGKISWKNGKRIKIPEIILKKIENRESEFLAKQKENENDEYLNQFRERLKNRYA